MPCGAQSSGTGVTGVTYSQLNRQENGIVTETTSGPWDNKQVESYCEGQCLSNFRKRLASGELLPFTDWLQYTINGKETGSYNCSYDPPGTGNKTWVTIAPWGSNGNRTDSYPTRWLLGMADASKYMSSNDYASCVHAAAASIYTQVSHDSLTFLAELGKTRQMVLNTAKSLQRYAFRKGFKPDFKFREVPGAWLEARYGWRPLLYDLNDLSKAVANLVSGSYLRRIKERSGYSDSGEDSYTITYASYSTAVGNIDVKTSYDLSIRGTVVADIEPPTFQFNPFATAWELVPYSFVMDWVVDVGSYIEAMSFLTIAQNYKAAGGYKFTIRRSLDKYPVTFNTYHSGWYHASASNVMEGVVRHPTTVALTPSARLRLNEFKVVDLLMLVKQRLGFRR